jgi:hypothetical protein
MRIDPRSWQREAIRPHTIAWLLVAGLLVLGGVAGVWAQQMDWLLKEAVDEHKAGNLSKAIEIYSDYLKTIVLPFRKLWVGAESAVS